MAEEIKPALAYEQMPRNITECDHNSWRCERTENGWSITISSPGNSCARKTASFTEAYVDGDTVTFRCDRCGSTKAFTQTIEEAVARMNALPRDASPAGS
jgi:hypothetical protein